MTPAVVLLLAMAPAQLAEGPPGWSTPASPSDPAAPTPSEGGQTLGVLPIKVEGLQLNDAKRLNVALRTRLAKFPDFAVQDQRSTDVLVESAQSLGLDCDVTDTACGAELGQIADLAFVLLGSATLIGDRVALNLALVNVRSPEKSRQVSGLVPAAVGPQMTALTRVIRELAAPSQGLGAMRLDVTPEEARVFVNGVLRGTAPLEATVKHLLPGEHHVRVELEGSLPYSARHLVDAGEQAQVSVALQVDPKALVERQVTWVERSIPLSITGVGVAMAGLGIISSVIGTVPYVLFSLESASLNQLTLSGLTPADAVRQASEGHVRAEGWAQAWNGWGRIALFGGAAAATAGLVTAGVGAGWTGYLLLVDVE